MPDEFFDDDFRYAADDETYDDGMSDPAFDDEADFGNSASRREKTGRAALRRDNRSIVASARREMDRDLRRAAKKAAKRLWIRRIRPLMVGHWERGYGTRISNILLMAMTSAYFQRFNQLFSENIAGATSAGDLVKIPVKSAIAAALAVPVGRKPGYTRARAQEMSKQIYQELSVAEKAIELIIKSTGSGEDDDEYLDFIDDDESYWETDDHALPDEEDDYFDEDRDDELDFMRASGRRRGRQPTSHRDCAKALRQAARYLLRVERRLSAGS